MTDGDRTLFSEDVARALDLLGQFHRLRMTFDDELSHERRARWRWPYKRLETMSWDAKAARSDELARIVEAYEGLWYRIHAVAPGLGGALPLP